MLQGNVLGQHDGYYHFTIGRRREGIGLGSQHNGNVPT